MLPVAPTDGPVSGRLGQESSLVFMPSVKRLTSRVGLVATIFSGLGPAAGVRVRLFHRGNHRTCGVLAQKLQKAAKVYKSLRQRRTVARMITILSAIVSIAFRLRARAFLELELIALRHQVIGPPRTA